MIEKITYSRDAAKWTTSVRGEKNQTCAWEMQNKNLITITFIFFYESKKMM